MAALLIPDVINSMRMMDTMRCHAVMAPFARIMAAIIGIVGIVSLVRTANADKKDLPKYGQL